MLILCKLRIHSTSGLFRNCLIRGKRLKSTSWAQTLRFTDCQEIFLSWVMSKNKIKRKSILLQVFGTFVLHVLWNTRIEVLVTKVDWNSVPGLEIPSIPLLLINDANIVVQIIKFYVRLGRVTSAVLGLLGNTQLVTKQPWIKTNHFRVDFFTTGLGVDNRNLFR